MTKIVETRSADALRVRIWDAPTRVFHWSIAVSFAGLWLTRDARYLDLHVFLGYVLGALVAFRIVWGFVGTRWARFASFAASPARALAYVTALVRRRHARHLGHNPAGAWSIFALLALGIAGVASGIVTLGAEKGHGPLAHAFTYAIGDGAHEIHEWLAWAMLAVVAVHVLGVFAGSRADRENLVAAMITGYKPGADTAAGVPARARIAVLLALAVAAAAAAYFNGYLRADAATPYRPFVHPALPTSQAWEDECGSCHLAYHPSLLPARSWHRLLAGQTQHFGEDLALEEETLANLEAFATGHAAESLASPVAWKMASTVPSTEAPTEITATRYWQARHERIDARTWRSITKSDCAACHLDAQAGTFEPGAIRIGAPTGTRKGK